MQKLMGEVPQSDEDREFARQMIEEGLGDAGYWEEVEGE